MVESLAGDDASGANTQCDEIVCQANQKVVNHQCVACPPGKTCHRLWADTSCDAVTCSTNERVQNHACVACPAGTTNDGGDDASQGDTMKWCVTQRV